MLTRLYVYLPSLLALLYSTPSSWLQMFHTRYHLFASIWKSKLLVVLASSTTYIWMVVALYLCMHISYSLISYSLINYSLISYSLISSDMQQPMWLQPTCKHCCLLVTHKNFKQMTIDGLPAANSNVLTRLWLYWIIPTWSRQASYKYSCEHFYYLLQRQ